MNSTWAPIRLAKEGMTAVEVLVASMLSALLMMAIMGTMRGLKAHEKALNLRDPTASWQRSLSYILQQDLNNARTIKVSPQLIELRGIGGRASGNDSGNWLPVVIRYEIRQKEGQSWLVRTERHSGTANEELVCHGVSALRISTNITSASVLDANREQAVTDGLYFEFLQADGKSILHYVFHQM